MVFPTNLSAVSVRPQPLSQQAILHILNTAAAPLEASVPLPSFGTQPQPVFRPPPGLEPPESPRKVYPGSPRKAFPGPAFVDINSLSQWNGNGRTMTADTLSQFSYSAACSDSEPPSPVRPPARRQSAVKTEHHATLVDAFRQLEHRDATTVLKLRKLQGLPEGTGTDLVLQHFRRFGPIEELHLVSSQTKSAKRNTNGNKQRPSGLGFLVMRNADAVEAILNLGKEQQVAGFPLTVERFEQARASSSACAF